MRKIEKRKADHIQVALGEKVVQEHNNWDDVKLIHNSLPEVDLDEIDTSVTIFKKRLSMPLIVTAITGGFKDAERINANLAEACAEMRVGLGIGSQRAAIENRKDPSYTVLKEHDVPLKIGNVGAPQLIAQKRRRAFTVDDVKDAMEMVDADVMAIHLNYLQEVAQPEGDTRAKGVLDAIRAVAREVPCIAKETGAGISREAAIRLKGTGIVGIDISGVSGTSFAAVEMFRARQMGDARCEAIGRLFSDWGVPAPVSLVEADVGLPLIASGGILNGRHVASSIVLGASCAGMAKAVLPAAMESAEAVRKVLSQVREELRVAMFLTGSKDIPSLAEKDCVLTGITREWIVQREG
ncbi:MAG: type 2 isopentenyl-diphosphate Delta-isomerase [Methanomassiliicoccales archaeon]|nr:MAG: type 2 isopentenyl-diphosphate Delta-isomerase [Methanomassiliicoccales archaeon]